MNCTVVSTSRATRCGGWIDGGWPKRSLVVAIVIGGTLCVFAFVATPASCEWGLSAYVWSGVAAGVVLFAAPFLLEPQLEPGRQALWGVLYVLGGAGVWFAALLASGMRVVCRLF